MKRFLTILMALSLVAVIFTGCGNANAEVLGGVNPEDYVTSLMEYKGLELSAVKEEITDEYVDSYIDFILLQYPTSVEVTDRPVGYGDTVNIDYIGKDMAGVAFEGGTAQGYDLIIGSGMFVPGFEDGLVGANVGDTVDVNLTFPENYHSEDLAGQDVVFTVTINKISISEASELTDEFVAQFGNETVEEFRETVVTALTENAEASYSNELQRQIIDIMLEKCEFTGEMPQSLIDYYKEKIYSNFESYATSYGLDVDSYVTQSGMSKEAFEENLVTGATESAKEALVCAMIAKKEGITVSDKELDEEIEKNYASFGFESAEAYKESEDVEEYRDYLLTRKVIDFIVDNANVTELAAEETTTETIVD